MVYEFLTANFLTMAEDFLRKNDLYRSCVLESLPKETAKANNLRPYEYFEHLLSIIPEHMGDTDTKFLDIRKPKQ